MFDINPESPYLREICDAFRRRRRAISHKGGAELRGERVIEVNDGVRRERVEITLARRRSGGAVCRLWVWSDRWAWVDAREGSKQGWRWGWTLDGRILGTQTSAAIVRALEETWGVTGCDPSSIPEELRAIWKPLLAKGPERQ